MIYYPLKQKVTNVYIKDNEIFSQMNGGNLLEKFTLSDGTEIQFLDNGSEGNKLFLYFFNDSQSFFIKFAEILKIQKTFTLENFEYIMRAYLQRDIPEGGEKLVEYLVEFVNMFNNNYYVFYKGKDTYNEVGRQLSKPAVSKVIIMNDREMINEEKYKRIWEWKDSKEGDLFICVAKI